MILDEDAEAEVEAAALWYEGRRSGLGIEFVVAIDRVLTDVSERPRSFAVWSPPWRKALVRRFPYAVFFEVDEDAGHVVVRAVAHARQRPGYWLARR